VLTREVLDRFARHYQTGQPMSQALVEKIDKSRKFNQGYATVEYLAAAILDMVLHTRPDGAFDPATFERDELARIGMPRENRSFATAAAVRPSVLAATATRPATTAISGLM
jgi:peptidyl-dipeptidase Dcp